MKQDNEPASAGDVDVRALDRAALLALIARVAPDLLPPDRPQRPVTERVSDILDAMPDHWQASWHALLDLLPICAEGDDLAVTDKAAAIAHFSAVRDTIAARLPGLRDDGEDLAGLIVDCDMSIADLSLHDPESDDELPSLEEARRELRAEGIDPDELGRRMRERVESMLREVTPDVCAEVPLSVGDLVITDDGTHGVIVCVQPLTACWDLHTAPPSPHAPRGGFTPRRWSVIPCPRGYTPKRREAAP